MNGKFDFNYALEKTGKAVRILKEGHDLTRLELALEEVRSVVNYGGIPDPTSRDLNREIGKLQANPNLDDQGVERVARMISTLDHALRSAKGERDKPAPQGRAGMF